MKPVAWALLCVWILACAGCETEGVSGSTLTKGERAVRAFNLEGLKIGDRTSALRRFSQVQRVPYGSKEIYEIYNPNESISMAVATFQGGRLAKLELRYFDGGSVRTLSAVGGWEGLRNYLVGKFGEPSRTGEKVPVATSADGINPKYAKVNAEWIFSRQNRTVHYIALTDSAGGIAVVTVMDTTPTVPVVRPAAGPTPLRRADPGF